MKITQALLEQIIREQLLLENSELADFVLEGQEILQQIAEIDPEMLEDVMDIWSDYVNQITGKRKGMPFIKEETK